MVNKDAVPFGFSEGARVALEQTHQAMDTYFDFLKKSISAFPSGGTEIGELLAGHGAVSLGASENSLIR